MAVDKICEHCGETFRVGVGMLVYAGAADQLTARWDCHAGSGLPLPALFAAVGRGSPSRCPISDWRPSRRDGLKKTGRVILVIGGGSSEKMRRRFTCGR